MAMTMKEARSIHIVFCAPQLKFIDYDPTTKQFTGIVGKTVSHIYDQIKEAMNHSIVMESKEESQNASGLGRLPGCFGMLQGGTADIHPYPYQMPLLGIENVTQVNASTVPGGTYIFSPYSPRESLQVVARGPLDSFTSVTPEIYVLAALMIITFLWIFFYMKTYVYESPKNRHTNKIVDETLFGQSLVYQVITHMIQRENVNYSATGLRYVSVLMSIFAFLYINMFSCLITSDKVSKASIFVYDSYEKILSNPQVQPVWVDHLDDHSAYMKAPKNTPQHRLWAQSVAVYEKSKDKPNDLRPSRIDPELIHILKMVKPVKAKQFVFFISNLFAQFAVNLFCNIICSTADGFDRVKDIRVKGTLDNQVPSVIYVLPISQHTSPRTKAAAEYIYRRVIETRIMYQPDYSQMLQLFIVNDYLRAKVKYNEIYEKCTDFERLPNEDPETVPLFLTNTGALFKYWAVGCLVSLGLLMAEHMHHASHLGRSRVRLTKPTV